MVQVSGGPGCSDGLGKLESEGQHVPEWREEGLCVKKRGKKTGRERGSSESGPGLKESVSVVLCGKRGAWLQQEEQEEEEVFSLTLQLFNKEL